MDDQTGPSQTPNGHLKIRSPRRLWGVIWGFYIGVIMAVNRGSNF